MSSLDNDRLPHEGPKPRARAGSARASAAGTWIRLVPVPAVDKDPTRAAAPRRRTATTAKATASKAKATAAKATASKAGKATGAQPTAVEVAPAEPAPAKAATTEAAGVAVSGNLEPATGATGGRRIGSMLCHRRRSLVLAAALVAVLGAGSVSAGAVAQAGSTEPQAHSKSVAAELGISAKQNLAAPDPSDAHRLTELTASRATREAEQTAAATAQQQAAAAAAAAIAEAARPQAVLPVNGARLTTCFCMRWGTMHEGIDLAAPLGTPEYAAMDGVVLQAGPASGFGLAVYIQHANGDVTIYGHMEQILVTAGQVVKAGDTIALLGNRGQSTGPHLHFGVHVGGINGPRVDPIPWLQARGVQVG